jgi:hypothetical protein
LQRWNHLSNYIKIMTLNITWKTYLFKRYCIYTCITTCNTVGTGYLLYK